MSAPPAKPSFNWRSKAFRGVLYQVVVLALLLLAAAYLLHNTLDNMRVRGIKSGFDFITQPAGFAIGESVVPFDSAESYGKAFLVGLSNTFRVAILGILFATVLGTLVGVGRLSRNFLVRTLSGAYVDLLRNVPLLLQLFIWYFVLTEKLPPIEEALRPLPGWFFSKNGLQFPHPIWADGHVFTVGGLVVGLIGVWWWSRLSRARFERTGKPVPFVLPAIGIVVLATLAGWLLGGAPAGLDSPEKTEINVVGGGAVTPEFLTVLIGLTVYTAAYIAEVVRAAKDHGCSMRIGVNAGSLERDLLESAGSAVAVADPDRARDAGIAQRSFGGHSRLSSRRSQARPGMPGCRSTPASGRTWASMRNTSFSRSEAVSTWRGVNCASDATKDTRAGIGRSGCASSRIRASAPMRTLPASRAGRNSVSVMSSMPSK